MFVSAAIFNAVWLPAWRISTKRIAMCEGMQRVWRDHRFRLYVFTLTGYYILAVQVDAAGDGQLNGWRTGGGEVDVRD